MKNDTSILPFRQSETIVDPLTELAREGARRMLAEALKAEADAFVASFAEEKLDDGRQRIVRQSYAGIWVMA
jgi:putative transposase